MPKKKRVKSRGRRVPRKPVKRGKGRAPARRGRSGGGRASVALAAKLERSRAFYQGALRKARGRIRELESRTVAADELVLYEAPPGDALAAFSPLDQADELADIGWEAQLQFNVPGIAVDKETVFVPMALEGESEGTKLRRAFRDLLDQRDTTDESPSAALLRLALRPRRKGD